MLPWWQNILKQEWKILFLRDVKGWITLERQMISNTCIVDARTHFHAETTVSSVPHGSGPKQERL